MKIERLRDISHFKQLQIQSLNEIQLRLNVNEKNIEKYHIMVCSETGCVSSNSQEILTKLNDEIIKHKLDNKVSVYKTGCFGFCKLGPIIVIHPENIFYCKVTENDVEDIIKKHIMGKNPVERLLYKGIDGKPIKRLNDLPFYHGQERNVLKNSGVINPENIYEYIAVEGYQEFVHILEEKTPSETIIKEIKASGLRGRGGGGFPTGKKWEFAYGYKNDEKFVVCNADEGDPGAFMDRSILEGNPHSVIEAMIIAGYTICAKTGYIYVRAEYPLAVERLETAIGQAHQLGLLGHNILNSGFDFDVSIRLGAGAFVCGEETALIQSIMGKRGDPRPRPPFPAEEGLWGKPTLNNNVETYANIPLILRKGADWFNKIGTENSKGTKVFALAGQIKNTGLIEVPMGTTLRKIIYDIGGGIEQDKKFKAVQSGGPSGGCIPGTLLDTPIDYMSLTQIGSMMGSGGLIVMDETDCMVDIARFYLEFAHDESCGKCVPCRIGTKRLLEILTKITNGKGTEEDMEFMEELCYDIKDSSLCGLGQTAPNPVLSTLKYFREEYLAHIKEKKCPAGVCNALLKVVISDEKCIACGICATVCPVNAITGKRKQPPFIIHQHVCIKCGSCIPKCPVKAISKQ